MDRNIAGMAAGAVLILLITFALGFITGDRKQPRNLEAFASERGVMVLDHETGVIKSREWRQTD